MHKGLEAIHAAALAPTLRAARGVAWAASAVGVTAGRVALRARRGGSRPIIRRENRMVFVVGSPRSGTTFVGNALGSQPGFVDLGEVPMLKAAVPRLVGRPVEQQAREVRRLVQLIRNLGIVHGLRGVEQNPETSYVLQGALSAYPAATAVHVIRDGRDVVCSLLERGWLGAGRAGSDDANQAYGAYARFWVEPARQHEFEEASEATRAAWAWRTYVTAARGAPERTIELRYESLVADPEGEARRVAAALETEPGPLAAAFAEVHANSIGRWRKELSPEQIADVEAEAGPLLAELGYD
jgi:sulfotransferase family protein